MTGMSVVNVVCVRAHIRASPAGWRDHELRVDSYGLLRTSERGQLYALVPMVANFLGLGDDVERRCAGAGAGKSAIEPACRRTF